MATLESPPQLYLFKQNRNSCIGAIPNPIEFTENVRFNACSEISFTVPDKYYDINTESWKQTQIYPQLERNRLVYVADDTDYFQYPVRAIGDSNFYKYGTVAERNPSNTLSYDQNASLLNFKVQPEVEILDLGTGGGYSFKHFAQINTDGLIDKSYWLWSETAANYNQMLACDVFIPVKPTDVIAVRNAGSYSNPITPSTFQWRVVAYEKSSADTWVGEWVIDGNGGTLTNQNSYSSKKGDARINVAELLPNGGYVRFWYECDPTACSYQYNSSTGVGSCNWTFPQTGYAKIYSGDRKCMEINNSSTSGYVKSKLHWFVITSVDEEDTGIERIKKVTALSYEYILHNTTFSLSQGTPPFYIPEAITNLVNSSWWVRDKITGFLSGQTRTYTSKQTMCRGVLNEILDCLPDWTVKYVSSKLMTTYRALDDVDDINIYQYLMSAIQSTYNCFIVFDGDDMTISAYTLEDLANLSNPIHLTWDNAIKSFEKNNMDASYFTALRVKAGDTSYGIGLVNPTGNGMIYDFSRIKDELAYVPSTSNGNNPRTLKDAVTAWEQEYNSQLLSSSVYQAQGKMWVDAHLSMIKAESDMEIALQNYRVKATEINTWLRDDLSNGFITESQFNDFYVREYPLLVNGINSSQSKRFHNASMQDDLASLASAVHKSRDIYYAQKAIVDNCALALSQIGKKLTLNYKQALSLNSGNANASGGATVLSANEIKELNKYIVEGVWTYENAAFSETYDANDILSTLREILDEARYALETRLSIANFDFTIDSVNITAIPEFKTSALGMYMGHLLTLYISPTEIVTPMLLEMHKNYKDPNDFSFTFTTDMKRKPIQFRFAELYSTISQTGVTDSAFTFDE